MDEKAKLDLISDLQNKHGDKKNIFYDIYADAKKAGASHEEAIEIVGKVASDWIVEGREL